MKTLYRFLFHTQEAKVRAVLRLLLTMVSGVHLARPSRQNSSLAGRYGIFATFDRLPSEDEIAAIQRAGARLSEDSAAALSTARHRWRADIESDVDRLIEAGEIKRAVIKRARQR